MIALLALTAGALLAWLFRHEWVTIEVLQEERVTKHNRYAKRYDTFYTFHKLCVRCGKKRIRVWRDGFDRRWEARTDAEIAVDEANELLRKWAE